MNEKTNLTSLSNNNSELALSKTKNLMGLVDRLLASDPSALAILKDESWMERLWAWADAIDVPDLIWVRDECEELGYWYGLPRNKADLLKLTEINLNYNPPLTNLPPEIGQEIGDLIQMVNYDLGDNPRISSLPSELVHIFQLYEIDFLDNSRFTNLPPEIGQLSQLTELNLSNNQLTSLPPEIGQLSQLATLELWSNQLTSLPPEIGQLSQLRWLGLGSNQLTSLPPEIGQLRKLTVLDLSESPLPPSEKKKLRRMLPNCEVK